jgi:competence protein ComEA
MFRRFITLVFATLVAVAAQAGIDVNKATQAELESIKGIGPGLSTRILEARSSAAFKDWNDMIERVPGVGPGNAARYSQAGLTVAGSGFDKTSAAPRKEAGKEAGETTRRPRGDKRSDMRSGS